MTDRSSEERSRFEKEVAARAALEDRQEAALEAPWVCPTCGAMVIGNRVYCFNCAERGLYTARPGVPSEATPSKENAELKYENEQLMGCVDSSHRQLASTRAYLDREGVAVQSFWVIEQFKDGVGGKYWAGDSSRDFVDDVEKAVQYRRKSDAWRATRGWHWTDIKHTEHLILPPAGTPAKEAQTKCSYCGWGTGHAEKCPAPAPEVQGTPQSVIRNPFDAGFQAAVELGGAVPEGTPAKMEIRDNHVEGNIHPQGVPAQTLAETPGFMEFYSVGVVTNSRFERDRTFYSAGTTKALHDARIWLFNQQGRAKLPEILAELLRREREAGGGTK